ncbi:MAG TPA: hypothetical protein VGH28_09890 [Polyangiaceae bacterium]|jgi:hypothetical protein
MKWTHATGLVSTFALIAAGAVWAGCSGDDNKTDGGGTDSGGNDATSQDSGGGDTGATDSGGLVVDGSVLDCTYYCTNIMAACTGTNQQYLDQATCMSMCNAIPNDAGAGATSGDSLACHMYHLSVAAQGGATADTHCPHAGPYGYGFCGDICNDFCEQYYASLCSGDVANGWGSIDGCRTACATQGGADAAAGAPGAAANSPTVLCKEYHLENAIKNGGDGGGHCDHAGLSGGGVCN